MLLAALALACGVASAQDRQDRQDRSGRDRATLQRAPQRAPQMQLDARYHHDRYYPRRGYVAQALPRGSTRIAFHGGSYFFDGGVWYRPNGPRFVVVAPPFGIVLPFLPPAYVTLRIGGAPYYYANGVYYAAAASSGYTVVPPPPGVDAAQPPPGPDTPPSSPPAQAQAVPSPEPLLYPRDGQSAAQTEAVRRECNRWATTQPNAVADASIFQRAAAACMDGRGYTVR